MHNSRFCNELTFTDFMRYDKKTHGLYSEGLRQIPSCVAILSLFSFDYENEHFTCHTDFYTQNSEDNMYHWSNIKSLEYLWQSIFKDLIDEDLNDAKFVEVEWIMEFFYRLKSPHLEKILANKLKEFRIKKYLERLQSGEIYNQDITTILIVPYSCATKNLGYDCSKVNLQRNTHEDFKNFWLKHPLCRMMLYKTEPNSGLENVYDEEGFGHYYYDSKQALGYGKNWCIYGDLEKIEKIFRSFKYMFPHIRFIVPSSLWNLYGLGIEAVKIQTDNFISVQEKKSFQNKYPNLYKLMRFHTVNFNTLDPNANTPHYFQRVENFIHHIENACEKTECKVKDAASVAIPGCIDWCKFNHTLKEYATIGGKFKWSGCRPDDPVSVIAMQSKDFIQAVEDEESLDLLTNSECTGPDQGLDDF